VLDRLPLKNYLEIGHDGYYDSLAHKGLRTEEYKCEEIKVWLWIPHQGLQILDASRDRRIDHSYFGNILNKYPFGRYEKCREIKRVSLNMPYKIRFDDDYLLNMIEDLKETFGVTENQIYKAK
jgi:hypothetical protein